MGIVRCLLDTCSFLWYAQEPAMLSGRARAALNDLENELFLSDVSVLEITLKHSTGKLDLPAVPRAWIPEKFAHHKLHRLALTHAAIFRSGELPRVHNDPFDRLLAAQALEEDLTILSPDKPLALLGARMLW